MEDRIKEAIKQLRAELSEAEFLGLLDGLAAELKTLLVYDQLRDTYGLVWPRAPKFHERVVCPFSKAEEAFVEIVKYLINDCLPKPQTSTPEQIRDWLVGEDNKAA